MLKLSFYSSVLLLIFFCRTMSWAKQYEAHNLTVIDNQSFVALLTNIKEYIFKIAYEVGDGKKENCEMQNQYFQYGIFVEHWNLEAKRGGWFSLQLKGSQIESNYSVCAAIIKLLYPFTVEPSSEFYRQLALMDSYGPNVFHEYEEFRKKKRKSKAIQITPQMDQSELAYTINKYLGVTKNGFCPSTVEHETLVNIALMQNFCTFWYYSKKFLHQKGIDVGIERCLDLTTNGVYSELDLLIRNNLN